MNKVQFVNYKREYALTFQEESLGSYISKIEVLYYPTWGSRYLMMFLNKNQDTIIIAPILESQLMTILRGDMYIEDYFRTYPFWVAKQMKAPEDCVYKLHSPTYNKEVMERIRTDYIEGCTRLNHDSILLISNPERVNYLRQLEENPNQYINSLKDYDYIPDDNDPRLLFTVIQDMKEIEYGRNNDGN